MNRLAAVKKLANGIISSLGLMPPVDLNILYQHFDIDIVYESNYLGIEAYSELNKKPKVVINPELTAYEPRRRFTMAHELGHVCIPWHNGDIKCDTDNNYKFINGKKYIDTQELEANIFASEILMPSEWMKSKIENIADKGFFTIVERIARDANTSVMACLYSLEDKLDSGHIYFIRNVNNDYYMTFKSKNTFSVNWNYYEEENIDFLSKICENHEKKEYAIHEVNYFELLPCPSKEDILYTYDECEHNIKDFLSIISDGRIIKSLTFLDTIIEYLPENYLFFIICGDQIVKRVCDNSSTISTIYPHLGIDNILATCRYHSIDSSVIELEYSYKLVVIKEKVFVVPDCLKTDPNKLLKNIVDDIYWYDYQKRDHMLKSINGLIASINGQYKDKSRDEIYNWAKYKYYLNFKYEEFCVHPEFETYIVNKIDRMISMRKNSE